MWLREAARLSPAGRSLRAGLWPQTNEAICGQSVCHCCAGKGRERCQNPTPWLRYTGSAAGATSPRWKGVGLTERVLLLPLLQPLRQPLAGIHVSERRHGPSLSTCPLVPQPLHSLFTAQPAAQRDFSSHGIRVPPVRWEAPAFPPRCRGIYQGLTGRRETTARCASLQRPSSRPWQTLQRPRPAPPAPAVPSGTL